MGQEGVRLHPGVPGGRVGATMLRWAAEPRQGEAPARVASFPGRDNQMYIFKHASAASPHSSDFSRLGGEKKKKKLTKAFRKTPAVPKRATGLPLPAAALGAHTLLFGLGIWVGIVLAGLLRPCRGCCGMQLEVLMVGAPPAAALRGAWQRPAQPAASPWLFASEFPGAGGKLGDVFFPSLKGARRGQGG